MFCVYIEFDSFPTPVIAKNLLNSVGLYDDDGYNVTQCSWEPYVFKNEISDHLIP